MQLGSRVARGAGIAGNQGNIFQNTCRSCGRILRESSHSSSSSYLGGFVTSLRRGKRREAYRCEASQPGTNSSHPGNELSRSRLQGLLPGGVFHKLAVECVSGVNDKHMRWQDGLPDGMIWFAHSMLKIHTRQVQARAGSVGGESNTKEIKRLPKRRRRLDEICVERYPEYSRTLIQSWIMQGKVLVEGQPILKAGSAVPETSNINIIAEIPKYVCRAGYKLEGALEHFACDVRGAVALDSGLSTGGFTDCLLQNGVARVYGVDVGYGQVNEKIRTDDRVVVIERTNLRYLPPLPELVDLVTLDLSFISILTVMPAVKAAMKPSSALITLIKPQFEAKRGQVGSGGIVRDPNVHSEVLARITSGIQEHGFTLQGWIPSPLKGADGNVEFLAYFLRNDGTIQDAAKVPMALGDA